MRIYSYITSERTQKTQGANSNLQFRAIVGDAMDNRQIADVKITHEKLSPDARGNWKIDQWTLWIDGKIVKQFRREKDKLYRPEGGRKWLD